MEKYELTKEDKQNYTALMNLEREFLKNLSIANYNFECIKRDLNSMKKYFFDKLEADTKTHNIRFSEDISTVFKELKPSDKNAGNKEKSK